MKKIFILIVVIFLLFYPAKSIASNNISNTQIDSNQIISTQKDSVNISKFIQEAKKYTEDVYKDVDYNELLNNAILGKIDNEKIGKNILSLIGKETMSSIYTIVAIMVIIIVHSILKSISEGLENKSISQISYYIQYILIVTLIMSNFAEIITVTKESISDLVAFSNTLVPVLITLVLTTGNTGRAYCG